MSFRVGVGNRGVDVANHLRQGDEVIDEPVPGMAECIQARCAELGLTPGGFADAAGLTRQGLTDVRSGRRKRYQGVTIYGVAKALRWKPDWYDRILDGQEPEPADEPIDDDRLDAMDRKIDAIAEQVSEVRGAVDQLAALLAAALRSNGEGR